jgi:hypothetical protein
MQVFQRGASQFTRQVQRLIVFQVSGNLFLERQDCLVSKQTIHGNHHFDLKKVSALNYPLVHPSTVKQQSFIHELEVFGEIIDRAC